MPTLPFKGTKEEQLWFSTFTAAVTGLTTARALAGVSHGLAEVITREAALIADTALEQLNQPVNGRTVFGG
jgi:hypothetical protein